ncbi:MAG: hypothetical protein CM1200mP22_06470 [Dehalococcoidia bacterium]|nr:MAG: hypothetical protein CM1200mP22_06470 [Dehalococcoidia bacterium]
MGLEGRIDPDVIEELRDGAITLRSGKISRIAWAAFVLSMLIRRPAPGHGGADPRRDAYAMGVAGTSQMSFDPNQAHQLAFYSGVSASVYD